MPIDEVVIFDTPQLYYTALRALEYCERYGECSSADVLRHAPHTKLCRAKRLAGSGPISTWLHAVLSHLVVSAARRQT